MALPDSSMWTSRGLSLSTCQRRNVHSRRSRVQQSTAMAGRTLLRRNSRTWPIQVARIDLLFRALRPRNPSNCDELPRRPAPSTASCRYCSPLHHAARRRILWGQARPRLFLTIAVWWLLWGDVGGQIRGALMRKHPRFAW